MSIELIVLELFQKSIISIEQKWISTYIIIIPQMKQKPEIHEMNYV